MQCIVDTVVYGVYTIRPSTTHASNVRFRARYSVDPTNVPVRMASTEKTVPSINWQVLPTGRLAWAEVLPGKVLLQAVKPLPNFQEGFEIPPRIAKFTQIWKVHHFEGSVCLFLFDQLLNFIYFFRTF